MVNVCRPPGEWQTYDITFHPPQVNGTGRVTVPGSVSVLHNGVLVIDDGRFDQPTGSARGSCQGPWGPVRLQDHGAPVRYRSLWLQPLLGPEGKDLG